LTSHLATLFRGKSRRLEAAWTRELCGRFTGKKISYHTGNPTPIPLLFTS